MRNFIWIFIGITIALSGQAIADVQKCVMRTGQNQNGSIAPEIILIYDEAAKSMQVYDGIIAHFNKEQPVVAKISSQRANNISFGWSVQMVNSQGQRAKMQYLGSLIINLKELHHGAPDRLCQCVQRHRGVCDVQGLIGGTRASRTIPLRPALDLPGGWSLIGGQRTLPQKDNQNGFHPS